MIELETTTFAPNQTRVSMLTTTVKISQVPVDIIASTLRNIVDCSSNATRLRKIGPVPPKALLFPLVEVIDAGVVTEGERGSDITNTLGLFTRSVDGIP